MFSSLKARILLIIYVLVIILIPVGAYIGSQQTSTNKKAEPKASPATTKASPKPSSQAVDELKENSEKAISSRILSPDTEESESKIATSFGPTLNVNVNFEGRPEDENSGNLFVGIVEGSITANPKFILSFTVELDESGKFEGISLAGLTTNANYSALLKGSSQIAKAVAFVMSPTVTNLNSGQVVTLLSGDLNEDNTINTADFSIVHSALGATSASSNWNRAADFNVDGIVNSIDLSFVIKNFGKIGDSGSWTSPLPAIATSSASLTPSDGKIGTPSGGIPDFVPPDSSGKKGYWLWIPGI